MSGSYRVYIDTDGWRWIGTPDQSTGFVALPPTAEVASGRIVEELNGLIREYLNQEARAEKAEAALDEAIARADKNSNGRIRTTEALREAIIRAEKAECQLAASQALVSDLEREIAKLAAESRDREARVAELEAQVAAWSPARHYGPEDDVWDRCPACKAPPYRIQQIVKCYACGWATDPKPVKTAPKTPATAPEPTGTVKNQAPAAGTDPSRHDPPVRGVAAGVDPAPVLGDPRALDPRRGCWPCYRDRAKGYASCPIHATVDLTKPFVPPRRATTCEDVKCPCVTLSEEAAAEVEARTGAVATDTLRASWGPASPENMLTFTTPDVWIVTPPRAGLPSRDEVAAFLEARWPK